jgi:cystathionine gamma-synthase
LACPFVILAHYTELDWVKQFGIDPYLVRISVGLEDREILVGWIENAIRAAEVAVKEDLVNGNGVP